MYRYIYSNILIIKFTKKYNNKKIILNKGLSLLSGHDT